MKTISNKLLIILYQIIFILILPIILLIIIYRKKEMLYRFSERFAITNMKRPDGILIWINSVSVGESFIAFTLIREINKLYPDVNFLLTSTTAASAEIIKKENPVNTIHQFFPIDIYFVVRKFFNFWKPNLGLMVESEIWPMVVIEAAKRSPLLLVNSRMSDKRFKRCQYLQFFVKDLLHNFNHILAQSKKDFNQYKTLNKDNHNHLIEAGNLKYVFEHKIDSQELQKFKTEIAGRNVILCVSTHEEDEEMILKLYKSWQELDNNLILMIAPRHSKRVSKIQDLFSQYHYKTSLRSETTKISPGTVYIINSFGELPIFYNVANITIIGGSFYRTGHNPIEAMAYKTITIFGPKMSNFKEISDVILQNNAAIQVSSPEELLDVVKKAIQNNFAEKDKYFNNAKKVIHSYKNVVLDNYIKIIKNYIDAAIS